MNHGEEFDYDKEREFCVRDVPASVNDWDIFHIFKKFGVVDNVRVPPNQEKDQMKYSFVTMINLAGADAVREALVGGKLTAGDLCLRVNDVRNGAIAKVPNKQVGYNRGNGKHDANRRQAQPKKKISYVTVDLPLGRQCDIRVVASPCPVTLQKGLTIHVLNLSTQPPNEYTVLQKDMNDYCHLPQNMVDDVEIGDAVLFFSNSVAYRAIRTGKKTIYLVDMGREEPVAPKSLYRMQERFAVLPTLVVECSLANVKWIKKSVELFQHIREVTIKWCESEGPLKATLHSFEGLVNMVSVVGSGSTNLTNSLVKRGDIELVDDAERRSYDREVMNTIRQQVTANPDNYLAKIENAKGILVAKGVDASMKGLAI